MVQEISQDKQVVNSPKKESMLMRFLKYIKSSFDELKKVVWLKRTDAIKMTIFVIVFVAVFALFIYVVDTIILYLFDLVLIKE